MPIIEAMHDELTITLTYQSFWSNESSTFKIEPYCVKVFRQRWYVVARSISYDEIRIYSLDRIKNLRTTETSFTFPKSFCPETFFDDFFGITVEKTIKACAIQVKVFNEKCNYLHTLPLHHSQQETKVSDNESVFSYFLSPTFDFRQELLSHGNEIEVLSPYWFRAEMAQIVKKMNNYYE
jgi:predicted DNA-binding transcriptional regulator YafY